MVKHEIHISQIQKFVMFFWPKETLLPGKYSHRMLGLSFINILIVENKMFSLPVFVLFHLASPVLCHMSQCVSHLLIFLCTSSPGDVIWNVCNPWE